MFKIFLQKKTTFGGRGRFVGGGSKTLRCCVSRQQKKMKKLSLEDRWKLKRRERRTHTSQRKVKKLFKMLLFVNIDKSAKKRLNQ